MTTPVRTPPRKGEQEVTEWDTVLNDAIKKMSNGRDYTIDLQAVLCVLIAFSQKIQSDYQPFTQKSIVFIKNWLLSC